MECSAAKLAFRRTPGLCAIIITPLFKRRRRLAGSRASSTVAQFGNTFLLGAVSTAKDRVVFFDPMTNDVCATIRASWCKGLDGTFETIECVAAAIHSYLERLVVIVTAGFAFRHHCLPMKDYHAFKCGHWEEKRGDVTAVQKVAVPTSSSSRLDGNETI